MKTTYKNIILVIASLIWGFSFTFQSLASKTIKPFSFGFFRFTISSIILGIVILAKGRIKTRRRYSKKDTIKGGILCGLALFIGTCLQQIGISHTAPGKAAFISVLYILFVPILAMFFKKKPSYRVWISVGIAIVGMYFLCAAETLKINFYDIVLILSAFFYALHIIFVDKYDDHSDLIKMNFIQSIIVATLSFFASIFFEGFDFTVLQGEGLYCVLYAGIMSGSFAYLLQMIGQKGNDPTISSLLLSLESVFALISGYYILNSTLTTRESIGCFLIFFAIILAQLKKSKN